MTVLAHPALGSVAVGPVDPSRLHPLRQRVLRPHQAVGEVALPGEDHPDCAAIAAVAADGEVVATGLVAPGEPPPDLAGVVPPGPAWRLRSMATRPDLRGWGLGAAVLEAAVGHVAGHGGAVVWCSARLPARRFYERAGFRAFGDPWIEERIGPHVLMWRPVDPPARTPGDQGYETEGRPPSGGRESPPPGR